jgi:hypothetical protein
LHQSSSHCIIILLKKKISNIKFNLT